MTSVDPAASSKLQFAVGVATISFNGGKSVAYGLNTVETLRQKDGLSGTLYNVPMIIGPSSFDVFTSVETGGGVQSAGSDFGTNHITWGTLNQTAWLGPLRGLKQSSTGAFGYGLCACNSDSGPGNGFTPLYEAFNLPIYGEQIGTYWYGGPPAFPAAGRIVGRVGLGRLLAGLHRFRGRAGDRQLSSLRRGAALIRHAAESDPESWTQRHADPAAGNSRRRGAADEPNRAAGVCYACIQARSQRRRYRRGHRAGGRKRGAGGRSRTARQRHSGFLLRPGAHHRRLLHRRSAQERSASVCPCRTSWDRSPNRAKRARPSVLRDFYQSMPSASDWPAYESSYPNEPLAAATDQRAERPGRHYNLRSA